jgi:peptidoglycan/xylan/chitin deacetylase (PgdA/CDA1 family)
LKTNVLPILERLGALSLLQATIGKWRHVALNYHNVAPDTLAEHVTFLRRYADIVDAAAFVHGVRSSSRARLVLLTFDDGYASFPGSVVPVLRATRTPALWFVPTALVDSDQVFWFDRIRAAISNTNAERVEFNGTEWEIANHDRQRIASAINGVIKRSMPQEPLIREVIEKLGDGSEADLVRSRITSRAQLQALDRDLIEVGSHSHTHAQLSMLSNDALMQELRVSKHLLEEWTRQAVTHFAFPSGDHDGNVLRAVREAGYEYAWTTEPRMCKQADSWLRLPRLSIENDASLGVLSMRLLLLNRDGR